VDGISSPNKVESCSENADGKVAADHSPDKAASGTKLF